MHEELYLAYLLFFASLVGAGPPMLPQKSEVIPNISYFKKTTKNFEVHDGILMRKVSTKTVRRIPTKLGETVPASQWIEGKHYNDVPTGEYVLREVIKEQNIRDVL